MKFVYPAVISQTEEGRFHAYFPDLAECEAEADCLEDVIERAKEAENNWITAELEDTFELPAISAPHEIGLKEGEFIRNISTTVKFFEGWEE